MQSMVSTESSSCDAAQVLASLKGSILALQELAGTTDTGLGQIQKKRKTGVTASVSAPQKNEVHQERPDSANICTSSKRRRTCAKKTKQGTDAASIPAETTTTTASLKSRKKVGVTDEFWNKMYQRLVQYKSQHCDCLVPQRHQSDPQLAVWVKNQRQTADRIPPHRKKLLNKIGFEWVLRQQETWETMFQRLVLYKGKIGDCLVPNRYPPDPKLGRWVYKQRFHKDNLPQDRLEKLESIGFVWNAEFQRRNNQHKKRARNES